MLTATETLGAGLIGSWLEMILYGLTLAQVGFPITFPDYVL